MAEIETEEQFEPYDHRDQPQEKLTKTWQTLMNFLKGQIGTGILAMHVAFSNSGTLGGILATMFFTVISVHCMHLIIRSQYRLCIMKKVGYLSYSKAVEYALEIGPRVTRKLSRIGYHSVDILVLMQQIGGCSCYILFIAGNVKQFTEYFVQTQWNVRVYCCLITIPLVILNTIRNLRVLAPFATMANAITILGLGFILSFVFKDLPDFDSRPLFVDAKRFPIFVGVVLFAMITIGLITSLENNMLKPADYIKPFGVLNIGYFIIMLLYMSVGLFGYIKYGYKEKLEGSITLELPTDDLLAQFVKLFFAIAITASYPIHSYVTVEIIMDKFVKGDKHLVIIEYAIRMAVVLLTLILAVAIPMLAEFISLIGALILSIMAFIFPPLLELCTKWPNDLGKYSWVLIKDILIVIFGVLSMIFGTYSCLIDIYAGFN